MINYNNKVYSSNEDQKHAYIYANEKKHYKQL